jgi:phytoene dehydrogenase-like protein
MASLGKTVQDKEVIVVGSGPNGFAAAIEMARSGFPVTIVEAAATVGGGASTAELTLPGYLHDICSAIHPLGASSPFFNSLPCPTRPAMGLSAGVPGSSL